jgi:hypothetical protein
MTDESSSFDSTAPILLVGLPRSGSTLWTNAIGSHPDTAIFTEMHYMMPWRRDFRYVMHSVGKLSIDDNVKRLVKAMFADPPMPGLAPRGFYFWKQIRELEAAGLPAALEQRILALPERTIGAIFRCLIEEATRCRGKRRALVKFPVYPIYLEELSAWWPAAKIMHISRDPRALAASKTNDPGGVGKLKQKYPALRGVLPFAGKAFAVAQYIWTSHAHERFVSNPNYRLFLYEQLVADPRQTIAEVCRFCNLEFNESMLHPIAGQASSVTGEKAAGFDQSRMHGWQRVLSPREARLIVRATRGSMRRFGYAASDLMPDEADA